MQASNCEEGPHSADGQKKQHRASAVSDHWTITEKIRYRVPRCSRNGFRYCGYSGLLDKSFEHPAKLKLALSFGGSEKIVVKPLEFTGPQLPGEGGIDQVIFCSNQQVISVFVRH